MKRHPIQIELMEGMSVSDSTNQIDDAQQSFLRVTDSIPEETWYWLALGSIGISATLKLMNKNDWAVFVGQWPPTFLLFGLYTRLVRPGQR